MYRRKDGRYAESYYENNKRKWVYGQSTAEVKQKIRNHTERQAKTPLFRSVAAEWYHVHCCHLAHGTLKGYKPAANRACDFFGTMQIADITAPDINKFILQFAVNHADKTVRTQLLVINLIMKYACSCGYISINPARDISVPRNLEKRRVSIPCKEDIARIKQTAAERYGLFANMCLYLGTRRSELLALTWEDVDLDERTVIINKSLDYETNTKPVPKSPKTEAGYRIIPILDALYDMLKDRKTTGVIFPGKNGYMTVSEFDVGWKKYCKQFDIHCNPHQLRHAYATMLYEHQDIISLKLASQMLGHSQVSTTADIYAEIRKTHQNDVFKKLHKIDVL